MHIWVDADACPGVIKDILFRAAERRRLPLTLVANRLLRVPPSPYIRALQVSKASTSPTPKSWNGWRAAIWW